MVSKPMSLEFSLDWPQEHVNDVERIGRRQSRPHSLAKLGPLGLNQDIGVEIDSTVRRRNLGHKLNGNIPQQMNTPVVKGHVLSKNGVPHTLLAPTMNSKTILTGGAHLTGTHRRAPPSCYCWFPRSQVIV